MVKTKKRVRFKSAEMSQLGTEPEFNGPIDRIEMVRALNWYNYFHTLATSKKWLGEYMRVHGYTQEEIRRYNLSDSSSITQTRASQARMLLRGAEFENDLDDHIKSIVSSSSLKQKIIKTSAHDQINEVIASIDLALDAFYNSEYKVIQDVTEIVKGHKPSEYSQALSYYSDLQDFVVNSGAYDDFPKRKLNKYAKQLEGIIDALRVRKETEKRRRVYKPRAKKPKTAAKQVERVKYLAHYKKFDISSISPEKILDATVLWSYDTKYRRLYKFVVEDGKKFTFSGSTLKNLDMKKSYYKTLRKPDQVVPHLVTEAKRAVEKRVRELTTRQLPLNTKRVNENHVLLKVFK